MHNDTTFRICRTCGKEYPLTTDYFHKHTDRLDIHCRDCVNQKLAEKRGYKHKRKKSMSAPDGFQCCTVCFQTFPHTLEYFHKAGPRLSSCCKKCSSKRVADWIKKNPEYNRKKTREWAKKNPERAYEFSRNAKAKNRAHYNEWNRQWLAKNRTKANIYASNRRARKRNLPNDYNLTDWQIALEYFDHSCAVCGRRASFWHVIAQDHWIPIKHPECPGTIPSNIIPLCHSVSGGEGGCNNTKSDTLPHDWLSSTYPPAQVRKIEARITAYFETVRK